MCSVRLTSMSLEGRTLFSESTRQRITLQPVSKNWLVQASWVVASSKQVAPQKTKKTNFNIGTGLSKQHQYATTYNQVTGVARGWNQSRQTYGDVTAKKTSVQLGKGNPYGFVTTNQRLFPNKDPNKAIQQPNKDFISSIKSSHFEVGSARPKSLMDVKRHYLSEANVKFNMKGNASQLRAKLDESKKNDLRRNHFTIGGPTANFKNTTANINYRPMTATQRVESRPSLNQEKMNSLRASHWTVGAESSLAG